MKHLHQMAHLHKHTGEKGSVGFVFQLSALQFSRLMWWQIRTSRFVASVFCFSLLPENKKLGSSGQQKCGVFKQLKVVMRFSVLVPFWLSSVMHFGQLSQQQCSRNSSRCDGFFFLMFLLSLLSDPEFFSFSFSYWHATVLSGRIFCFIKFLTSFLYCLPSWSEAPSSAFLDDLSVMV